MRRFVALVALALVPLSVQGVLRAQGAAGQTAEPLPWAYAVPPPPPPGAAAAPAPAPDNTVKQSHPGSKQSFTAAELRNRFGAGDWFPEDRPAKPMPEIVAKGRAPNVWSCTLCHLPSGKGRPENAGVTGLSASYFVQTMMDYKLGRRKSAEPRKGNVNLMIGFAKEMTEEEIHAAADYFSEIPMTPWVRVVETTTVPKMRSAAGLWVPLPGTEKEPIGTRIIETPEDMNLAEGLRSTRSGFVAYVPPGSVKKGETLVKTGGNGRTVACGTCHGADLKGLGPVPGIAGRSPSYIARQLWDFKAGARSGEWSGLMKDAVAKLTPDDFVTISAYVGSLMPLPVAATATR